MTASPNKGFNLQATGSNSGTWGTTLNDEVITYLDDNLGGRTAKDLTGLTGGAATFSLTAAESRSVILYLSGVLSANITITTACIGFFWVENNTTGAFTVTIKNSVAASGSGTFASTTAVIPQKSRVGCISDNTQGVRIAGQNGFASQTSLVFTQASAPIGWTVNSSLNNYALRIASSGGGTTGGGAEGFTTAFVNKIMARANLPNINLTDTTSSTSGGTPRTGVKYNFITWSSGSYPAIFLTSSGLGTNIDIVADPLAGHTHAVSIALNGGVTQTAMIDVQYVNAQIYNKD
jgi:hypothetical protein